MTLHHPVEASFRAEAQEVEAGQEESLDDLGPGVVLGGRATCAANGPYPRRTSLELLEQADELARIRRLEHKGIAAGDRVVLTGDARTGDSARGHRLKAHQAERLVATVREHAVGAAEQHSAALGIERGLQVHDVRALGALEPLEQPAHSRVLAVSVLDP